MRRSRMKVMDREKMKRCFNVCMWRVNYKSLETRFHPLYQMHFTQQKHHLTSTHIYIPCSDKRYGKNDMRQYRACIDRNKKETNTSQSKQSIYKIYSQLRDAWRFESKRKLAVLSTYSMLAFSTYYFFLWYDSINPWCLSTCQFNCLAPWRI